MQARLQLDLAIMLSAMSCFLTHADALTYTRLAARLSSAAKGRPQKVAEEFRQHKPRESAVLNSAFRHALFARPLSVAVPYDYSRVDRSRFRCRIVGKHALHQRFLAYEKGIGLYCSAAELLFLQLAEMLPAYALAAIGCELCGSYLIAKDLEKGFVEHAPLTTKAKIASLLEASDGARGVMRAREALSYVAEDSASPMETYLLLRLALPRRLGGFGIPQPVLNAKVTVRSVKDGPRFVRCDLYWPESRLAVEYDSDSFHADAERMSADSRRRALLSEAGVTVLSATRRQVFDEEKLEELARAIGKNLGVSLRCRSENFRARRPMLGKHLLRAIAYPSNSLKGEFADGLGALIQRQRS